MMLFPRTKLLVQYPKMCKFILQHRKFKEKG